MATKQERIESILLGISLIQENVENIDEDMLIDLDDAVWFLVDE